MASTRVVKKKNQASWLARACPDFCHANLHIRHVLEHCGWRGGDQRHLWIKSLSKFRPICAGISGLTAEPCPENGSVQVVRRAHFELRWLFCSTLLRCSTC